MILPADGLRAAAVFSHAKLPLAFLAGAAAALGFAPWALWPLTLIGVAALLWLLDGTATRRGAFAAGWWFGVGHFTLGLGWIAHAFTYQDAMPPWLGWVAVVGLAMFLALYPGLAAFAGWHARRPVARVLLFAAAWMLAEWLRGWVLSGFSWHPLGSASLPLPAMPQLAGLIGAVGLSGLAVLAGGALWLLAARRAWRPAAAIAGALVLAAVSAALVMFPRMDSSPAGPQLHIVQPNIGQEDRWEPSAAERHLQRQLNLTAGALGRGERLAEPWDGEPATRRRQPALVLWPESAVQGLVEEDAVLRARLAGVLAPGDLLLFGGVAVERDAAGRAIGARNSLFVIDHRARLLDRYDKAHLVPLGEYVPAQGLMTRLGLARLAPGNLGFLPGPGPRTLTLPGFPDTGVQICYEIIFPSAVVEPGRRPGWLLQPSNDSWYGASMPPQHLDQARLRAIEEGLPVARATPTGISALIDARGRVLASLPQGEVGVISADLPPPRAPPPFARFGHLTSLVLGLLLIAGAIWDSRRWLI